MRTLILALVACLAGCTTSSSFLVLHEGDVAGATAYGDNAFLTVRNHGPANIVLTVDEAAAPTELAADGIVGYRATDAEVAARVTAKGRTTVEFEARRAKGLAVSNPAKAD